MIVMRSALGTAAFVLACVACGGADANLPLPPPAPHLSPPPGFAQLAPLCARITACARPYDPDELREPSACVDHFLLRASDDPRTACLVKAKTCKDVSACIRETDAAAASFCAAHPGVLSACDGTRFVTCADPAEDSNVVDCSKLGGTCAENRLDGGLVVRGCVSASLCPASAPETRCDGDRAVVTCRDGMADRTTCKVGTHCSAHHDPDGDAVATCVPSSEARCDTEGRAECRGDVLVECVAGGHYGRARTTDCKAHGLACESRGTGAACVAALPSRCVPFPARCNGSALEFCAAGTVASVSCASAGMGACDPSAHGPEAACRPAP